MSPITIPKRITHGAELVVLSKRDYEKLLIARVVPEYIPTVNEKKALNRARKNRIQGNFFTINELKQKLGFTR